MGLNQYEGKDAQLFYEVQKLKDGNYESYQNVYELSKLYIYKIINDIVQNHHTTEDMMQETYLQIYNKINTLNDARAFYVWAGRIASNFALQYLRKYRREVLIESTDDDGEDFVFENVVNDNEAFIPETVLENEEQQRIIAGILEGLSPEQKLTVQYYYYEEMSVGEIADLMECSAGTVKSRLNYARKSLKTAVSQFEIANDVRLYSMATLPVFFLVFKSSSQSLVIAGSAVGAAVAGGVIADGAAVSGGSAGGAAAVSGGAAGGAAIAGSAGAAGSATASTGFIAAIAGKVAVAVVTVVVGGATAVSAAQISENNMIEEKGYVITKEEVMENVRAASQELYADNPFMKLALEQSGGETAAISQSGAANTKDYDMLEEFVGEYTSIYDETDISDIDEEYLDAVNELAGQYIRYEQAMEYSLTDGQKAYIDELMSGFATEMENYIQQGGSFTGIMNADATDTFRDKYYEDMIQIIYKEADVIGTVADIYSREEVKEALAGHSVSEVEQMINMGGGIGDVIYAELSESTRSDLAETSNQLQSVLSEYVDWINRVSSDPVVGQYFAVQ